MWWQSLINGFLHKFYLLINFVLGLISSLFGSHFRNGSSPAASSSRTNNNPFRTLLQNRTFRLDNGTNIRINSLIAEGGFAFVYAASCVDSSRKFACKVMNVHSDEQRCSIEKEILIHTTYGKLSENILSLVDSTFIDFNDSSLTLCLLLLPYVPNGTLRCHIDTRLNDSNIVTPWRERELLEMFRGVCEGVNVLHNGGEKPVTHRDIKPENILINSRGEPILMDFGGVEFGEIRLKSRADALKLVDNASSNSTMSYRAPELFEMVRNAASEVKGLTAASYRPSERQTRGGGAVKSADQTKKKTISISQQSE